MKSNPLSPQQGQGCCAWSISRDKPSKSCLEPLEASQICSPAWLGASRGPQPQVCCLTSASGRREALAKCTQQNGKQRWEFTDQMVAFHPQLRFSLVCQPQNFSPAGAGTPGHHKSVHNLASSAILLFLGTRRESSLGRPHPSPQTLQD